MVLIRTANQQMAVKKHGGYVRFVERMVQDRWGMKVNWQQVSGVVAAEIVNSDWRASCPFCQGAMVIEPGLPYFCPDCAMQGNDFRPMWVQMPEDNVRREIEALLLRRNDPVRRNWFPHETIADIRRENLEHGVR